MAESSLLVSTTLLPFPSIISRLSNDLPFSLPRTSSSSSFRLRPSRLLRLTVRSSSSSYDPGNFIGDDSFGFFPWVNSDSDSDIRWIPEDRVTLFTSEGLVQIGGSLVPRRVASDAVCVEMIKRGRKSLRFNSFRTDVELALAFCSDVHSSRIVASMKNQGKSKISQRSPRFQESDYMDPDQGLCLGALFDIAATNGLDMGRRLCILGFCRSIEMLSDVVEDAVLEHGGEVVAAEKALKGGLHEKLTMTVAVPLLWGVPPASETLHLAVRSGGGIVDKVFWQWDFC